MKYNLTKSKISKLNNIQTDNETNLTRKSDQIIELKTVPENLSIAKAIYDSGWLLTEIEDITGAYSQTENLLLPQRANFDFSFTAKIPIEYLPYLSFQLVTQTADDQTIQGVGQFIYTGLQEVLLNLYDWKGVTYVAGVLDLSPDNPSENGFGYWVSEGATAIPIALPNPDLAFPPPSFCYTREAYWTHIEVRSVGGSFFGYNLSRDGKYVLTGADPSPTYAEWVQYLFDTYNPGSGIINLNVTAAQDINFSYPVNDFPIPIDPDDPEAFGFPCASDDPGEFSTPTYPSQYWEQQSTATFQDLLNFHGYTYTEAANLFNQLYPALYITPEEQGAPYKAYKVISQTKIESGKKITQINQRGNEEYDIRIYGNLLIVSPADTPTDFSDENNPTFKPNSDPIQIRLVTYIKKRPIEHTQIRTYLT